MLRLVDSRNLILQSLSCMRTFVKMNFLLFILGSKMSNVGDMVLLPGEVDLVRALIPSNFIPCNPAKRRNIPLQYYLETILDK